MRDLVAERVAGVSSIVQRGQGWPAASALITCPQYGQQTLRPVTTDMGAVADVCPLEGNSVVRLISSSPASMNGSVIPDSTFRRTLHGSCPYNRAASQIEPGSASLNRRKTV